MTLWTKSVLRETKEYRERTPPDSSDNPPRVDPGVDHVDPFLSKKIGCVQDDTVIVNPGVVLQRQE